MTLAFQTALIPNNKERAHLMKACGVARFAFNWGLAEWEKQYREFKAGGRDKKPNGMALKKQFNAIKKSQFPWVYEVTKYACQQPFIHLNKAWERFFNKVIVNGKPAGRPKFKKKGRCIDSFYVGGDQVSVRGNRVKIPNLGWIKMAEPLKYGGKIINMTIRREADKWMVSFQLDVEMSFLRRDNQAAVGVDFGIKQLATLSRGEKTVWENPAPLKSALRRLARMQRKLSKKVRGSGQYKKLSMRIARLHRRIANIRKNTLHQLTSYLVKHFRQINIEDLNVRGMMANRKLARAVADVGFYEARRQLTYKSEWYERMLEVIDRWFPSSKLCSGCGWKHPALTLSDRVFHCGGCGSSIDRDENASINIENYTTASSAGIYAAEENGPVQTA